MVLTCGVPACKEPKETEDCCRRHSYNRGGSGRFLRNDGILDWEAIRIAAQGSREVEVTWVENDIAAAMLVLSGASGHEIRRRLGVDMSTKRRRVAIEEMAHAMQEEGYGL